MITLITGVPGSGKTLYAVTQLLQQLVGQSITLDDGTRVPRKVYANINGLLLEHDLVDDGTAWERHQGEWRQVASGGKDVNKLGLHNWHEWAGPGAVIVADECQRPWPVRPNGSPVPPDVDAMDTHRHMGVDFILMSQTAAKIDQNVRGLVGRHLHIRRVGNLPFATIYEWDHCSRQLLFSNAIARAPWRFPRKGYRLYSSAKVHTKMPRKLPGVVFLVPLAIAAVAYLAPKVYATATGMGKVDGTSTAVATAKSAPAPAKAASAAKTAPAPVLSLPDLKPAKSTPDVKRWGCAMMRNVCRCYDEVGEPHQVEDAICVAKIEPVVPTGKDKAASAFTSSVDLPIEARPEDVDVLAFMGRRRDGR